MFHIAEEHKFIYAILVFYGFLFLLFSVNGNDLYNIGFTNSTFTFAGTTNATAINCTSDCWNIWIFNVSYPVWNTTHFSWTSCDPSCSVLSTALSPVDNFRAFLGQLFIMPFINQGDWVWFGFINWAIFGTAMYLLIRLARGGG